jgi:hypothetical protein
MRRAEVVRRESPRQSQEISVKKAKSKTTASTAKNQTRRVRHSALQRKAPPATLGSAKSSTNSDTKHDKVLAMLRSDRGATIAAIMKATGWQQHSVRGFLAGVVRKRLKLDLVSEKNGKVRIYRINGAQPSASKFAAVRSVA